MSHQESHDTGSRSSRAKARRRLHLRDVTGVAHTEPYNGIGTEMRAARLRTGVDLPVAAAELRISFQYLQAIEEGRFNDLPGPAYAQGFLRSYAEYLDIDADVVSDAYKAEASDVRPASRLAFPSPLDRGRLPTGRILAASIILAGLVYSGWYLVTSEERRTAEVVTQVPERLAQLVAEERRVDDRAQTGAGDSLAASAATVETADAETASAETAGVETAEDPAPRRSVAQDLIAALPVLRQDQAGAGLTAVAAREVVAAEAAALIEGPAGATEARPAGALTAAVEIPLAAAVDIPPAPPPLVRAREDVVAAIGGAYVPQVYGAGTDDPRVVLIASVESWVQVRSAAGELLLTRILRPGDRYLVPNRGDLLMMTGNAGALRIYVDGKAIPAIGPLGAVRRDISLEPGRLLLGEDDSR